MLIDTVVIIWYLRGDTKAFKFIEKQNSFYISVITYMELVQGMRNKHELNLFRNKFREWNAKIAYINEEISAKAMFYVERHFLSSSFELTDALICAMGILFGLPLVTCNDKHYRMIKELEIKIFRAGI